MKKVIFVDDDPDIQELMSLLFENSGYKIEIYSNGESFLKNSFSLADVIILDKRLPDIDGLEVCQQIKEKEETKDTPIIMLSADPDIQALAEDAGAEDSIKKPFNINILKEKVAQYVD